MRERQEKSGRREQHCEEREVLGEIGVAFHTQSFGTRPPHHITRESDYARGHAAALRHAAESPTLSVSGR